MSTFQCPVVRVSIEPHANADALEIARVGGYMSIVKKGQFKDGDLAVYLPEQAVLPEPLLKHLGFWDKMNNKGTLSSAAGNRVRAIKLRGVLSQGVLVGGAQTTWHDKPVLDFTLGNEVEMLGGIFLEGEDAAETLGVTKYEPQVPAHMAGKVAGGDLDATIGYDFENLKKSPDLFIPGEIVVITEKLHGTCLQVGIVPRNIWEGKPWADKCPDIGTAGFKGIVTSKGQGARGLMIDPSDDSNLYVRMVKQLGLWEALEVMRTEVLGHPADMPLHLFGEIFGPGVQDLTYGKAEHTFRAFDLHAGTRSNGFYVNNDNFARCLAKTSVPCVPKLYVGPYSDTKVRELTDGNTVEGGVKQIREGIVIKSAFEAEHPRHGRKIAKSVSEAYLLRKNATEYT